MPSFILYLSAYLLSFTIISHQSFSLLAFLVQTILFPSCPPVSVLASCIRNFSSSIRSFSYSYVSKLFFSNHPSTLLPTLNIHIYTHIFYIRYPIYPPSNLWMDYMNRFLPSVQCSVQRRWVHS